MFRIFKILIVSFLFIVVISGCIETAIMTRIPTERFFKTIDLCQYKIYFVSHKEMFLDSPTFRRWDKKNKYDVDGFYVHGTKSIWVLAYKDKDGKIWPWSECLLGHEFLHLLNHIDSIIVNPDPSSRKKEIEIID